MAMPVSTSEEVNNLPLFAHAKQTEADIKKAKDLAFRIQLENEATAQFQACQQAERGKNHCRKPNKKAIQTMVNSLKKLMALPHVQADPIAARKATTAFGGIQ